MKALSGYAEWFWLLAKGWKDVENRSWPLSKYVKTSELPLRFYLHASKTQVSDEEISFIISQLNAAQLTEFADVDWNRLRGHIIGEATAVGEVGIGLFRMSPPSPWYFGPHAFLVQAGVLYDKPIPYRGQLGFFPVNL